MATDLAELRAAVTRAREELERIDALRDTARIAYYDAVAELQRAQAKEAEAKTV